MTERVAKGFSQHVTIKDDTGMPTRPNKLSECDGKRRLAGPCQPGNPEGGRRSGQRRSL
jgi:hypothetical protein